MTTIAVPAPNRASTPRPKQPSAAADSDLPSRRTNNRPSPADPLSDRGTENLIRRTLCPQQSLSGDQQPPPIEDLLPPLSSRNDVDLQLYAFLAIILREFVQSWYSRITTDETFVQEVLHVIAHCSRALEQRFRKVDMHSLILDEIPDLLDKHVTAYRMSHRSAVQAPLEIVPHDVYHSLCPLPALSPVPCPEEPSTLERQQQNEALYRQLLVQGVLTILLPTEDLENPCLTALVEQIFSELIVGNVVVNKAAQPWLLFEGICIIARVLQQKKTKTVDEPPNIPGTKQRAWSIHGFVVSLMTWILLVMSSLRLCFATLLASSSLPARSGRVKSHAVGDHAASEDQSEASLAGKARREPVPVLEYRLWASLGNVTELGSRMPWLSGVLSLLKHGAINGPWHPAALDGSLDRILTYHIATLLDPTHLPSVLRTLRGVLFPNNAPGTPSLFPPSSDEALLALRRRAASALWALLPKGVGRLYFGGRLWRHAAMPSEGAGSADQGQGHDDDDMVDEVEGLLMVLSDEYCNKHLVYGILELVLVRLMPELAEKGVVELMEERLG